MPGNEEEAAALLDVYLNRSNYDEPNAGGKRRLAGISWPSDPLHSMAGPYKCSEAPRGLVSSSSGDGLYTTFLGVGQAWQPGRTA